MTEQEVEIKISVKTFEKALEFVKYNLPSELVDEYKKYKETLMKRISAGDRIDAAEIVHTLMDPKKFSLPQEVVEQFLRILLAGEPAADKYIAGTIERARRIQWEKE